MRSFWFSVACILAVAVCVQGVHDIEGPPRKLINVFEGFNALNKAANAVKAVDKALDTHLHTGVKAGQKIAKDVNREVKQVLKKDAKVGQTISKATGRAINAGEKALVIGVTEQVNKVTQGILGPLTGTKAPHHSHSAAAKEAQKAIKAVDIGKKEVAHAIQRAAGQQRHAVEHVSKSFGSSIEHATHQNSAAKHSAARAVNKAVNSVLG